MPASKVSRVRSEGFSKNRTICLPDSTPRKSAGRAFIDAASSSAQASSSGEKSWIEIRSRPVTLR